MPDTDFRYLLLAGLAIALVTAAITDLRRRQIDNGLNAAIALTAPLYWWASGLALWPGVAIQLGLALAVFIGFAVIFARGGMGGGDVKLLAALALWLPPAVLFGVIVLTSLVGGAMSMVAGARNLSLDAGQRGKRMLARSAAGLWVAGSAYAAWVINGGAPLGLDRYVPAAVLSLALAGALVATGAGAVIVSRHQKTRLPIPYGVAISAGALLFLFNQIGPIAGTALAKTGLG
ncbi:MAG: prepilin peptidase [Alphaproteobacteria bacterium]